MVQELIDPRRAVKSAKANGDEERLAASRGGVDSAKRGLGGDPSGGPTERRVGIGTWRRTRPMQTGSPILLSAVFGRVDSRAALQLWSQRYD